MWVSISVRPYAGFAVPYVHRTFEILPYRTVPYRTVRLPYRTPYILPKNWMISCRKEKQKMMTYIVRLNFSVKYIVVVFSIENWP